MRRLIALLCVSYCGLAVAAGGLPDAQRTHGAINPNVTQANIDQTICVKGFTKTIRPPANYTNALKKKQIKQYRYADKKPADYEEDHLVPLETGGHPTDPKNLWPQPRKGQWNAAKKDRLENVMHQRVCSGQMTLAAAQVLISNNWVAAYKSYVK